MDCAYGAYTQYVHVRIGISSNCSATGNDFANVIHYLPRSRYLVLAVKLFLLQIGGMHAHAKTALQLINFSLGNSHIFFLPYEVS